MTRDSAVSETSDPATIGEVSAAVQPAVPQIRVLKGEPTDEELAALVAVLSGAAGGAADPGPRALNQWGQPEDKLRYAVFSWQRVTLLGRSKMRR